MSSSGRSGPAATDPRHLRRRRHLDQAELRQPTAGLYGVAFPDASHGWAVGRLGTILATSDGGAHWKSRVGHHETGLDGVAFADASHGWAVGTTGGRAMAPSSPRRTAALTGRSRRQARSRSLDPSPSLNTPTAGRWATDGTILATTDGGAHWTSAEVGHYG